MFSKSSNICKKLLELKGRQSSRYYTISQQSFQLSNDLALLIATRQQSISINTYVVACLAATSVGGKKGFRLRPIDVASTYINNYYYYYFVVVFFQLSNDLALLIATSQQSISMKVYVEAKRIPRIQNSSKALGNLEIKSSYLFKPALNCRLGVGHVPLDLHGGGRRQQQRLQIRGLRLPVLLLHHGKYTNYLTLNPFY